MILCCGVLSAQQEIPWFGGGDNSYLPNRDNSPMLEMTIRNESDESIPEEVVEDIPFMIKADSEIFLEEAPIGMGNSFEYFDQPQWLDPNAKALWFLNDLDTNKSYMASYSPDLPVNQIIFTPTNPAEHCSITCYGSRKMKYVKSDGRMGISNAKANAIVKFRVKDITPPTCGFSISVENGESGEVRPVETPVDKPDYTKTAQLHFSGYLFNNSDSERISSTYNLGEEMVIKNDDAILNLKKDDVLKVKIIKNDNYILDEESIVFGICGGAGGISSAISQINNEVIELSEIEFPDNPYLFLEAKDNEGNVQKLFLPINIQQ